MELLIIKILVTIAVVVGLSVIAERVSPRVAGVLAGYPTGTSIVLFFYGLEQGAHFAAESAVYMMSGLAAELVFLYCYYKASSLYKGRGIILISTIAALVGFSGVIWLLHFITFNLYGAAAFYISALFLFNYIFKHIPEYTIQNRVKLNIPTMTLRASLAAGIIILITWAAHFVSTGWAGLLAAFPVTLYPLILIIHWTYGKEPVHTFIRHITRGLWSLLIYLIALIFTYPILGVYWGTLVSLGFATVYLMIFNFRKKSI